MMNDRERAESRAKRQIMDAMIDSLIAIEQDPKLRGTMVVLRTCGKIQDRMNFIAERVTTKAMANSDGREIRQLEEYMTVVLAGMDNFLEQIGVTTDGKT